MLEPRFQLDCHFPCFHDLRQKCWRKIFDISPDNDTVDHGRLWKSTAALSLWILGVSFTEKLVIFQNRALQNHEMSSHWECHRLTEWVNCYAFSGCPRPVLLLRKLKRVLLKGIYRTQFINRIWNKLQCHAGHFGHVQRLELVSLVRSSFGHYHGNGHLNGNPLFYITTGAIGLYE